MHHATVGPVIVATYSALFGIWAITRRAAVQAFSHQPVLQAQKASAVGPPDRFRVTTTIGVLWVFLANIVTSGLFVGSVLSPALVARLPTLRLELPRIVNRAGAGLFVLNGAWCKLALIYNPGYRRFLLKPKGVARLWRHRRTHLLGPENCEAGRQGLESPYPLPVAGLAASLLSGRLATSLRQAVQSTRET